MNRFTPRLTRPESGNRYYNTPDAGGYAVGVINGNPLDPGCNVLSNCVGYAAGRFNEILGQNKFVYFRYPRNPVDWISDAIAQGLTVGFKPELGCVMVWNRHVAVVEKIESENKIITSESGYGCQNPFWISERFNTDGKWGSTEPYLGCIYLPDNFGDGIEIKVVANGKTYKGVCV